MKTQEQSRQDPSVSTTPNGRKQDPNSALMRAMGGNGSYDPEPPDQWRWALRHGWANERALAWIKSKTIAYGHGSPFATGDDGQPLSLESMAAELGWKPQTARNVLNQLCTEGRARYEKGRIWLSASVPDIDSRRTEGEDFNSVQSCLPSYLIEIIQKLPEDKRAELEKRYSAFADWQRQLIAETMASARAIADQFEDSILLDFGVKRDRIAKRRPEEPSFIQLELRMQPNFVQSWDCANSKEALYKPQNGSVQTRPPYIQTRPSSIPLHSSSSKEESAPVQGLTTTNVHFHFAPEHGPQPMKGEFRKKLEQIWAAAGKPVPNAKQVGQVAEILPVEARWEYLEDLESRIGGMRHPGVLASDAEAFARAWPERLAKLERDRAAIAKHAERRRAQEEVQQREATALVDDPLVNEERCGRCGGLIQIFASGSISACACKVRSGSLMAHTGGGAL